MKDSHAKIIELGGFVYWETFFKDRRGNPWTTRPSLLMYEDYQIFYMSKKNALTYEIEAAEVFFDREYIDAWMDHTLDGLKFLDNREPVTVDTQDKIAEFESLNDIVTSSKNPRHSLYIKFKEFIYNDN